MIDMRWVLYPETYERVLQYRTGNISDSGINWGPWVEVPTVDYDGS